MLTHRTQTRLAMSGPVYSITVWQPAPAAITGKTPDSCRSLIGKWLKTVNDEAIHILGAIEDAERNRIADPVRITRALSSNTSNASNGVGNGTYRNGGGFALNAIEFARRAAENSK